MAGKALRLLKRPLNSCMDYEPECSGGSSIRKHSPRLLHSSHKYLLGMRSKYRKYELARNLSVQMGTNFWH
jgi:hypothetical protein